ncbi:MAG: hypothetical protein AAF685_03605 [Cyanobacteria bacterium P01_C01_bin.89]
MAQPVVEKLSASWIIVAITMLGAALRTWQLADHPLWSDEFATLVFSLGHGFADIPLDQPITGNRLLEALTVQDALGAGATWDRLLSESNHPPLYFLLSNRWIHLWQGSGQLVNLGVARSLPALFGVLAIPGTYALMKLASGRNKVLPLIAALLMAVSPFGIYLSQETRHYTLGLVWGIASLGCWVIFLRHWNPPKRVPPWLPWAWIGVNGLGIATHFFVGLLLLAQGITIGLLAIYRGIPRPWRSLAIAALGTAAMAMAWVPYAQSIPKDGLTDWLLETVTWTTGFEAIARLVAWTITMGVMLPVESSSQPTAVVIISGGIMGVATGLMVTGLVFAWRSRRQWDDTTRQILIGFGILAGAIAAVTVGIVLVLGKDITVAARYQFVTLPVVVALMAVGWWGLWQRWRVVAIAWLAVALVSGGCVAQGLAFQRPDRPDLMVEFLAQITRDRPDAASIAIATVYKNHEQTGEMLGLAWEWRSQNLSQNLGKDPQFILARKASDHPAPNDTVRNRIANLPKPLNLWLVNFAAPENLKETAQCQQVPKTKHRVPGYTAKLYRCLN